ncbi:hypothetical protein [Pararhizobium sp.]|uniref:hypothetical protein n=1 Tax=Pararhizobium sp. TaxID=1977563 RepID=UPI003D0DFA8D
MKVVAVDKTLVAFLIDPPAQALPAVQEAWDHAADARFGLSWIEKKLTAELRKVHLKAPSRSALNHWVGAIQANLITRPKAGDQAPMLPAKEEPTASVSTVVCGQADVIGSDAPEELLNPYLPSVKGKEERAARKREIADPAYLPLTTADHSAFTAPVKKLFLRPEDTLREIADRLIHEEEQALQQNVREQARRNVTSRLRAVLEQLEAYDA